MKSGKSFARLDVALLIICLFAVGIWLYRNVGSTPMRLAQVTPISPTTPTLSALPTETFVSPAVVRATSVSPLQVRGEDSASASTLPLAKLSLDDIELDTNDEIVLIPDNEELPTSILNISTPHSIPTPMPASGELERGESLQLMQEFDRKWDIAPDNPLLTEGDGLTSLYLSEFFNDDFDPWSGTPPTLSDKLLSLDGKLVEVKGYMAPPLKLGLDWFLLGDAPIGACPFHSTAASITSGTALVYVDGPEFPFSYEPVNVIGELHVGELTDPETGMVSIARIYAEKADISTLRLTGP